MTYNVQQEETGHKGRFFIEQNKQRLAEMTYSLAPPTTLIIDHTEVDESLRGSGAGLLLLEQAVLYARKQNYRILPLCPFAKAMLNRHSEWHDVLSGT